MSEKEFKIKELERLFSEGKVTLEQYLDARAKIENSQPPLHETEQFSSKPQNLPPQREPPRTFQANETRRSYRKIVLGIVLSLIILVAGFTVWGYLNPLRAEALTIESYSMKLTKGAVLFRLKNTGNTDVRISEVKMNGYLNQSLPGWPQGWNGTTLFQPQQTGSLYVYVASYFYVFSASMPHLSSPPSQTEVNNFYSWMESINSTFTFVTNTQRQYNVKVPEFAVFVMLAWMGSLTFTFMKTEELKVISHTWDNTGTVDYIDLSVKNTGTETLTMSEVRVNDLTISNVIYSPSATLNPGSYATIQVNRSFASGVEYEFAIITATGNRYTYVATAP